VKLANVEYLLWPDDVLRNAKIPERSKNFLREEGLPNVKNSLFEFSIMQPDSQGNLPMGSTHIEAISGSVFSFLSASPYDCEKPARSIFTNSSAESLSKFIFLYEDFCAKEKDGYDDMPHVLNVVYELERQMLDVEPSAVADENNTFWGQILAELRLG
jgi:hypothetical protein